MNPTNNLSFRRRLHILLGLLFVGLVGLLFMSPIPQDPAYHLFADTRSFFGIPNFGDVVSNAGFALAGILGSTAVLGARKRLIFSSPQFSRPYAVFFIGIALLSMGSAYYHWEPGNERLFWDRLPMSIAFMAFASAIIADRIHANAGNGWLLLVLIVLGVSSLLYWHYTEQAQRGDLRFYAFIQFYPLMLVPFILWLFPRYHYVPGRYIGWVIAWYGLSKVLEQYDAAVFELLGYTISGHSLKHLSAAVASFVVLKMLMAQTAPQSRPVT